jgi:hypothetical protein
MLDNSGLDERLLASQGVCRVEFVIPVRLSAGKDSSTDGRAFIKLYLYWEVQFHSVDTFQFWLKPDTNTGHFT